MKTEKYFIQEYKNVWLNREGTASKKEWFDWYGTIEESKLCISSDFDGFDALDYADSAMDKIPKLKGDELRIVKRTSIITDEEVYYEKH
jgi:hypothetical protein